MPTLRYAVQSEMGLRSNNEDAAFAGPHLLALADGMGGHAAGEIAASIAIEQMAPLDAHPSSTDLVAGLRAGVERANAAIAERARNDPLVAGMGTTLTALLFEGSRAGLAHVGDSRAYLWRDGELVQITRDDTLVQDLVDRGVVTPEQAARHPQRSAVMKVLTGEPVEPFLEMREVDPGDRYLICSDGLSDYVSDEAIAEGLAITNPARNGGPQGLIRLAMRNGSQDNVTCIVAEVVEGDSGFNIAMTEGASGWHATLASR